MRLEELKKDFTDTFIHCDICKGEIDLTDHVIPEFTNANDVWQWIASRFGAQVSQTSELTCEQKLNDLADELSKEVIDKYKFINENKEPLIEGVLDGAEIEWFLYFKEKIKSFCEQP